MDTMNRKTTFGSTHNCLLEFIGSSGDIPSSIESRNIRLLTSIYDDISCTIFCRIQTIDNRCLWLIPDCYENPIYCQLISRIEDQFFHSESSFDRSHARFKMYLNIGMFCKLIYPHRLRTKFVSPNENMNFLAYFCKIERFGDSSISPTNQSDISISEKHPIAGCTIGNSGTEELLFSWNSQFSVFIPDGEKYIFRLESFPTRCFDSENISRFCHTRNLILDEF